MNLGYRNLLANSLNITPIQASSSESRWSCDESDGASSNSPPTGSSLQWQNINKLAVVFSALDPSFPDPSDSHTESSSYAPVLMVNDSRHNSDSKDPKNVTAEPVQVRNVLQARRASADGPIVPCRKIKGRRLSQGAVTTLREEKDEVKDTNDKKDDRSDKSEAEMDWIIRAVNERRVANALGGDNSITWKGRLFKTKSHRPHYVRKVFLGGLCRDLDAKCIKKAFQNFGLEDVEWNQPLVKGFAYLILKDVACVDGLLKACEIDLDGKLFYRVDSNRPFRDRKIQVIPWDAENMLYLTPGVDARANEWTIFVGGLHGEISAKNLYDVMMTTFGNVGAVVLDVDKYNYPSGAARVKFTTYESYKAAVSIDYVNIVCHRFAKVVQIDPYLVYAFCGECNLHVGPVFCKHRDCSRYYCGACFCKTHRLADGTLFKGHVPITRHRKAF